MALSRSTYYDTPSLPADAAATAMIAVCDEFEAYGYRRLGAELRHGAIAVNFKKIRRPIREHGSQPQAADGLWQRPTIITRVLSS
jgi:putative transposase